jgi:hypothetical protein
LLEFSFLRTPLNILSGNLANIGLSRLKYQKFR